MSDAKTARIITIANSDDFRKIAAELGVVVGERGALPAKRLAGILLDAERKGEVQVIDTQYFSLLTAALGSVRGEKKVKPEVSFTITYKMVKDGKPDGNDLTLSLPESAIRSYLPNVKGKMGGAFATMVLALHLANEEATIEALLQYAVSDVERVETYPVVSENAAETTERAPEGDDTEKPISEGDKATEDVPAVAKPLNTVAVGDETVKVSSESAPKPVARTRKANAKASKELANA